MKVLSQRELILGVVLAWKRQYPVDYELVGDISSNAVLRKLEKLDLGTCTASDVDLAIEGRAGIKSGWVWYNCSECNGYDKDWVVEFGGDDDLEISSAQLCRECLQKAADLLK